MKLKKTDPKFKHLILIPFRPFFPHWIPILQGLVLVSGLYFAMSRDFLAVKDVLPDHRFQMRAMLLPALLALLVVNLLLKLYMG